MVYSVAYPPDGGKMAHTFSFSHDRDINGLHHGDSILHHGDVYFSRRGYSVSQGLKDDSCCDAKQRVVWTEQEDELLRELIAKYGTTKWSLVASKIPTKNNRHCRRRWQACLNAIGNKGAWTPEEDAKLIEGHRVYGNRWTEIAKLVPGRTDNAAKNRFVTLGRNNSTICAARPNEKLAWSSSSVSGSDSSLSREVSLARTLSDLLSGCTSHKKRSHDLDKVEAMGKRQRLFLDLNMDITAGGESDSDESALVHEGEGGVDRGTESLKSYPACHWLDLNVPDTSSAGCASLDEGKPLRAEEEGVDTGTEIFKRGPVRPWLNLNVPCDNSFQD